MFKNRDERKRQKQLKHLNDIADAFLKARGVYPADYEGFMTVAGQKDVNLFLYTMYLIDKKADEIGFEFAWWYDATDKKWKYKFLHIEEIEKNEV